MCHPFVGYASLYHGALWHVYSLVVTLQKKCHMVNGHSQQHSCVMLLHNVVQPFRADPQYWFAEVLATSGCLTSPS